VTITSLNPHDPADIVGEWEPTDAYGVDAAVAKAQRAADRWRSVPAAARGKALAAIADALEAETDVLVSLTVREVGKPVTEPRGEVSRAVSIFRYYAQMVLAPDGETLPARRSRRVADREALPARRLHLDHPVELPRGDPRHGDGATGRALVDHPGVAAVSFTGSVPVGMDIARRVAERGVPVQCEMGGQNPSIVLADADADADADLDRAASTIAYASMGCAGRRARRPAGSSWRSPSTMRSEIGSRRPSKRCRWSTPPTNGRWSVP
jgi:aldehyde dehydrogenase (NAD+)